METTNPNYVQNSIGPGNTPLLNTDTISTPSPISVSSLTAPASPIAVPPSPSPTNTTAINSSVPSPVPTPESIINNADQPTSAQTAQTGILAKIASLMGGNTSLATLQTNQESAAGIPALTKTTNDLTTQILGLNDQATSLQNDAAAGGKIQNQGELNAQGLRSEQGQAPLTASALRQNQIQQSAVASQALTLKSAYYAAQGNLTLAKDSADKAAQVQFDAQQQQINYQKSLLDALGPQLTRDQQAQSLLVQAQLNDRQTSINQQLEDKKTGTAMAIAALTNNPNDPTAQQAGQAALKLDPTDPQYLQKISALVAKYQQDPIAAQTALANLTKSRAEAVTAQNNAAATTPNDPNAIASLDPGSQSILAQTGLSVAAFNFLTQGTSALTRMTAAARTQVMNEAQTFLNKKGLDYSTFQSQYKAQNNVVQSNIERAANTKVFGGEVSGTVSQFIQDVGTDIPNLKVSAVTELFAKGQTNDPVAQKYAFDLQTMQNDLAGYYAASRGANSPDQSDLNAAANVITNGLSGKGASAFKSSIDANIQKVSGVVNAAVTNAQQSIWQQFGVGDKYKPTTSSDTITVTAPDGTTGTIPKAQLADALKAGYKLPAGPMNSIK